MLQLAASSSTPVDQFRVAAAPDSSKLANPYVNRLTSRQTLDPSVADRDHRFPRNGSREALIAHTRDENIQTLAPRRERLDS
jgi:hypothetical protein